VERVVPNALLAPSAANVGNVSQRVGDNAFHLLAGIRGPRVPVVTFVSPGNSARADAAQRRPQSKIQNQKSKIKKVLFGFRIGAGITGEAP
jgi:hypothetical protein